MNSVFVFVLFPFLVHSREHERSNNVIYSLTAPEPEDAFERDCVDSHNTFRLQHGVAPLAWSADLTQHAQRWADELASKDEIKHDVSALIKNSEGENLAFFRPAVPKCQDSMVGNCVLCREMVKRWYDEGKMYDYDMGSSKTPEGITKHFTQIIWANTSEVGIGTAISKKYGFITVARYWPEGNKGGAEMYILNIPPEGGPLPSISSNESPAKSAASTIPMGNGIPVTDAATGNPPKTEASLNDQTSQKPKKAPNLASVITPKPNQQNQDKNVNQQAAAGNDVNANDPHGHAQNDDLDNTFDSHMSKDFGYENGENMYGNVRVESIEDNGDRNEEKATHAKKSPFEGNSNKSLNNSGKNEPENAGHIDQKEREKIEYSSKEDGNVGENMTASNRRTNDSEEGDHTKENENSKNNINYSMEYNGNNNTKNNDHYMENNRNNIDHRMEKNRMKNYQVVENNTDNKMNNANMQKPIVNNNASGKKLNMNSKMHKEDGLVAKDFGEALKNKGLVRTVKGPDGTSAQVFLTKNGAHAGLVFRDQISRVSSPRDNADESNKRMIHAV